MESLQDISQTFPLIFSPEFCFHSFQIFGEKKMCRQIDASMLGGLEYFFAQVSRQSWKVTHKLQKSSPIWYSTV